MSKSGIRLALLKMGRIGERHELDYLKRRFQKWYRTEVNACTMADAVVIKSKMSNVVIVLWTEFNASLHMGIKLGKIY